MVAAAEYISDMPRLSTSTCRAGRPAEACNSIQTSAGPAGRPAEARHPRGPSPPEGPRQPVPPQYAHLRRAHPAHKGEGLGPGAMARVAGNARTADDESFQAAE